MIYIYTFIYIYIYIYKYISSCLPEGLKPQTGRWTIFVSKGPEIRGKKTFSAWDHPGGQCMVWVERTERTEWERLVQQCSGERSSRRIFTCFILEKSLHNWNEMEILVLSNVFKKESTMFHCHLHSLRSMWPDCALEACICFIPNSFHRFTKYSNNQGNNNVDGYILRVKHNNFCLKRSGDPG